MDRKNAIGENCSFEAEIFLIEIILNEDYDISVREAAYYILTNIIKNEFYQNNIIELLLLSSKL